MPEDNKIKKSLGELEEELSKIKSASDMIQDAKKTATKTVNETKIIMKDLIANSKKASDAAINESKKLNTATSKLLKAVDVLMKKLDKVDFPTRLDKLDTTVSGVNSGIQNILSRFDNIERNLKDDFENKFNLVHKKLDEAQEMNQYLQIGILIGLGAAFTFLFYKLGFIG